MQVRRRAGRSYTCRAGREQRREQVSWGSQVIWKGGKFRGHPVDGWKIKDPGFKDSSHV